MMKSKHEKILLDSTSIVGFFDSGIGGLTVLQQFISLPISKCIYVADTANMPYGNKSFQEIKEYSQVIVDFLLLQGTTTIIISCHTATALTLKHLRELFKNITIIGVIDLVTQEAAQVTKNNRIGIIATQATIASGAHKRAILNHNPQAIIFEQSCPLLASAIEFNTHQDKELDNLILGYIQPLLIADVDTLILGSTHYDVIKEIIKQLIPSTITIVSAHELIAQEFTISTLKDEKPNIYYYVTGDENTFLNSSKKVFEINNTKITKLSNVLLAKN